MGSFILMPELTLKFLANENIPFDSVMYLRMRGFDILSIGSDYAGISDEEVMRISIKEERVIITYDSDYGELIFKHGYKPRAGVVFIRNQPIDSSEAGKTIERLLISKKLSFHDCLTVVDLNSIRQRRF